MKKPYIICHMMTSVDGRIDCAMTEHLPGVQEYYDTLDSLNAPTRVSGRVTAELELAGPGVFHNETVTPFGREGFSVLYRYEFLVVVLGLGVFRIGPACSARVSRRHFRAFLSRVHEAALFLALHFALPSESVVNRQGRSVVSAEKNREVCRRAEIGSESGFGCGTEIGGSPETKKGARTRKIFPFFT